MSVLTRAATYIDGRLCHEYTHDGQPVMVCDSARNMLLVIELFSDETLTPESKANLLMVMLFPDPNEVIGRFSDIAGLLIDVVWQACGLNISNEDMSEKKVFDWDEDAARIKASLSMAYGINWDEECDKRSYMDICDLLSVLLESQQSTPFSEAVHYRTAEPPEGNKYNQKERERFFKLRKYFALKSVDEYQPDADATAIFDRIWREVGNE